jgi:hypothetical protein
MELKKQIRTRRPTVLGWHCRALRFCVVSQYRYYPRYYKWRVRHSMGDITLAEGPAALGGKLALHSPDARNMRRGQACST